MLLRLLLLASATTLLPDGSAQDGEALSAQAPVPEADPRARERWESFARAARSAEDLAPVQGFDLHAHARTREGVQTNELDVRYRFLEPHYIRFKLPNDLETGRGPGKRGGFWLREGEDIVELAGRNYVEDRDLVLRGISLARNFLALTDPERIKLKRIELLDEPDFDVLDVKLRRLAKKLEWVRVASPSFALAEALADDDVEVVYRVDLGLDPETHLPTLVSIQRDVPRTDPAAVLASGRGSGPLLIHLQDFRGRDGFVVPHLLYVRAAERLRPRPTFAERAAQEIAIRLVDLRPTWKPENFLPTE